MKEIDKYLALNDVQNWLKSVDVDSKSKILRKLNEKNSNDELNLLAILDELMIGAFLFEHNIKVHYNFNIDSKRPDWYDQNNCKLLRQYLKVN